MADNSDKEIKFEIILSYAIDNKLVLIEAERELARIRDTDKQTYDAIVSDLWQRYAE